MVIEVTQILGNGSVRHAVVVTAGPDAARWEDLAERAAVTYPPAYRAEPGQAVYDIRVGNQVCQVGEEDLVGPLLKLVTAVLAESGGPSDAVRSMVAQDKARGCPASRPTGSARS